MWKKKVSFSYDNVTGHTTVRVRKTSNRINHCFIFRGTAEEAKTAFEAHLNAF